jgi:hypothetical protein
MASIWAALSNHATKGRNIRQELLAIALQAMEAVMAEDREKISNGPNDRPINETIAGTADGIPDDSLSPGEDELPEPPTDEQVEKIAEIIGAPTAERDTLPLEGE